MATAIDAPTIARVLELFAESCSVTRIAIDLDMDLRDVSRTLKDHGLRGMRSRRNTARNAKIIMAWEDGLSTTAIGERFDLARSTVGGILRKSGVDIKSAHRHRYDGRAGCVESNRGALTRMALRT